MSPERTVRAAAGSAAPVRRPPVLRGHGRVVAVVALGGAAGAAARYGAGLLWPGGGPERFPWTTLLVNVVGCALIGVLLVVVTEGRPVHPLVRPFLGTGVLGGFTTFSTYAVDVHRLLAEGRPGPGLAYLGLTLTAAMAAVWAAAGCTRRFIGRRPAGRRASGGTR